MTELTNERDVLEAFADWMKRRGALGAGASPERIFIAGWAAARRATPSTEGASLGLLPPALSRDDTEHDVDYYTAEQVEQIRCEAYARGRGDAVRDYVSLNDAALAADRGQLARQSQEPQAERDGWKWVPVKLTDDMAVAFAEAWYSEKRCYDDPQMDDCYAAMLAAAPAHPVAQPAVRQVADTMDHAQLAALGEQQKGGDA